MKPIIIGLAGQAGCGKDTFAKHLWKNMHFIRTSFAHPLKHCVKYLFKMSDEQIENRILKEMTDDRYGLSPRQIMQLFGTEFCRKMIHQNFWVNRMEESIKEGTFDRIVISDVRFPNEADLIRKYGTLVHINRPNNPLAINSSHESEQILAINTGDICIDNNDLDESLYNFERAIKYIYWEELAESKPVIVNDFNKGE